jgi:hypothetical protein
MSRWSKYRGVALLGTFVALAGCEAISGSDDGRTRIMLSQVGPSGPSNVSALEGGTGLSVMSTGPSASSGYGRGGGAVLALVDDLSVTITAVQALPVAFIDRPHDDGDWETLTFGAPVDVNLLSLPHDSGGLEIVNGDLPPGAYVRLRFLVSEANLVLLAPLTLGDKTFPAFEDISISLPHPWVSVPGAFFTVDDVEGAVIQVEFDPGSSLGQLTVGPGGSLRLSPVFHGRGYGDRDDDEHDHDDDDDDDDDRWDDD